MVEGDEDEDEDEEKDQTVIRVSNTVTGHLTHAERLKSRDFRSTLSEFQAVIGPSRAPIRRPAVRLRLASPHRLAHRHTGLQIKTQTEERRPEE